MLNPLARTAIHELKGMGVDNLTSDEVVTLHILGEKMQRAGDGIDVIIEAMPVSVGNIVLYPFTACSADWYDACMRWFEGRETLLFWALPFALSNGRNAEVFAELNTAKKAGKAVIDWIKTLTATRREIDLACIAVIDIELDTAKASARASLLEVVEFVRATSGSDANAIYDLVEKHLMEVKPEGAEGAGERKTELYQYWITTCAMLATLTGTDISEWYKQDRRLVQHCFNVATEKASGGIFGGGGSGRPSVAQERINKATKNFYAEFKRIVDRRKQPESGEQNQEQAKTEAVENGR